MQHPRNYKYYLNVTKYGTFRVNDEKYQEYLDAKKYYDPTKPRKPQKIKSTVTP